VAIAVNERLARLEKNALADRLLDIGRRSAERMDPKSTSLDHGALYDDRGLPV
jgi:antitoxin VapB